MGYWNIGVLAFAGVGAWWLSAFDSNLADTGWRGDFWQRFLRVLVTLLLVEAMILMPPSMIVCGVLVGVIWAGCISDLLSRWVRRLFDPGFYDNRPLDPGKSRRYMDTIAHLIKNGRRDEAVKLCEELKHSDEVDVLSLESTLEFLGVKQEHAQTRQPLKEAVRFRAQGKFIEAEQLLKSLLAKNPADADAAMMLMRLCAGDLKQPGRAHEILRKLEKQPHVSPSHLEFARRSIDEWSTAKPEKIEVAPPKSVDELVKAKLFGSAIEMLEEQIQMQPLDYELRLKLVEIHAVHCQNFQRAGKLISRLEGNFSAQQIASARAKLKEWRERLATPLTA